VEGEMRVEGESGVCVCGGRNGFVCRYSCMCREETGVVKEEPGEFMEGEMIEHGGRFMGWVLEGEKYVWVFLCECV